MATFCNLTKINCENIYFFGHFFALKPSQKEKLLPLTNFTQIDQTINQVARTKGVTIVGWKYGPKEPNKGAVT